MIISAKIFFSHFISFICYHTISVIDVIWFQIRFRPFPSPVLIFSIQNILNDLFFAHVIFFPFDLLIGLMTFSGKHHDISRLRVMHHVRNRLPAVMMEMYIAVGLFPCQLKYHP